MSPGNEGEKTETEKEVRGKQGEMGTGEGGGEVGEKGWSLLAKAFIRLSMSEIATRSYIPDLLHKIL